MPEDRQNRNVENLGTSPLDGGKGCIKPVWGEGKTIILRRDNKSKTVYATRVIEFTTTRYNYKKYYFSKAKKNQHKVQMI